jgi:murein DD-endopeptidase MepM/ murein hydrolase activator NlpD
VCFLVYYHPMNKIVTTSLIGIISLIIVVLGGVVHAQTVDQLQGTIDQKQSEISSLEAEIAKYQSEASKLSDTANDLATVLKRIQLSERKLEAQINLTKKQIDQTTANLVQNQQSINMLGSGINRNTSAIEYLLRVMNSREDVSVVEFLGSSKTISQFFADVVTIEKLNQKLGGVVLTMKDQKQVTEQSQVELQRNQVKLIKLQNELGDQEKIVATERAAQARLVKDTKNREGAYRSLVATYQKRRDALDAEIRDYESKLKFALDQNSLPTAGSRVLAWPLDAVTITQRFGRTADAKRLYVSGSHSGVDFRASVGTPVYAVASGTVEGTGDTDQTCYKASFGKWVFIRHNNGLASTYGHLSLIKASEGQSVSKGQLIGYSGNTGRSTGPHLHLTIYASRGTNGEEGARVTSKPSVSCPGTSFRQPMAPTSAYLDPLLYLPGGANYKN